MIVIVETQGGFEEDAGSAQHQGDKSLLLSAEHAANGRVGERREGLLRGGVVYVEQREGDKLSCGQDKWGDRLPTGGAREQLAGELEQFHQHHPGQGGCGVEPHQQRKINIQKVMI